MAYLNGQKVLLKTNVTTAILPIDQTYSPESENAQSGKAVAQAVANAGGGQYELIETITVAEEGLTSITRNTEPNGNAYSFKDIYIAFRWINGAEKGKWIKLQIWTNGKQMTAFRNYGYIGVNSRSWIKTLYHYGQRLFVLSDASANTGYATYAAEIPIDTLTSNDPIDKIVISHEINLPAGTEIKIWGIRA